MTVEGIKNFQNGLTQYLSSDEAVFINDAKTHTLRGVYLPASVFKLVESDFEKRLLEDAKRSFSPNPFQDDGIDALDA